MQDLAVGFRASAPTLEIKSPASAALSAAPVKWVKLLQLSIRSGAQEPVLETEIRISENLSTVCGSCVQITPSERMGRAELRPPEAAAWSLDLAVLRAILDGEPNPVSAKRASRALCAKFRSAAMGVGGAGPSDRRCELGPLRSPKIAFRRPLRTASARFAAWVEHTR